MFDWLNTTNNVLAHYLELLLVKANCKICFLTSNLGTILNIWAVGWLSILKKLVKVKETSFPPSHPPSNGPTCLPCEKCIDHYKVVGSRPSLFLWQLSSRTAYLMSNWGAALTVKQGKILLRQVSRSPFIGCLILLSLCQSAAWTHTHSFSHFSLPSPSSRCLRSPRVAASVVLVKRPVFRSHMVTECEFWAEVRVIERGEAANLETELDYSPDTC